MDICKPLKGNPSRLSAADTNPRSRKPAGDDPCNNEPRKRVVGDGTVSIEGAKDRGFKEVGEGGKREGAGPEGDGGGSNDCKLLL